MKTTAMCTLLVAMCVLVMGLSVVPTCAQAPKIPHAFYGVVEVNGEPAPAGTRVEARGTDVLTGIEGNPITTAEVGKYGGRGGFDPKLVVQGNVEDDTLLEFYVGGVRAQCAEPGGTWLDSYPFKSGGITELNLRVGAPAAPTEEPTEAPTPTTEPTQEPPPTAEALPTSEPTIESPPTAEVLPTGEPTQEPPPTAEPPPTSEPTQEPPPTAEVLPTGEPTQEPPPTAEVLPTGEPTQEPTPTTRREAVVVTPTVEAQTGSGGDSLSITLYVLVVAAVAIVLIWVRRSGAGG